MKATLVTKYITGHGLRHQGLALCWASSSTAPHKANLIALQWAIGTALQRCAETGCHGEHAFGLGEAIESQPGVLFASTRVCVRPCMQRLSMDFLLYPEAAAHTGPLAGLVNHRLRFPTTMVVGAVGLRHTQRVQDPEDAQSVLYLRLLDSLSGDMAPGFPSGPQVLATYEAMMPTLVTVLQMPFDLPRVEFGPVRLDTVADVLNQEGMLLLSGQDFSSLQRSAGRGR